LAIETSGIAEYALDPAGDLPPAAPGRGEISCFFDADLVTNLTLIENLCLPPQSRQFIKRIRASHNLIIYYKSFARNYHPQWTFSVINRLPRPTMRSGAVQ
jgi:hypothetical protein